MKRVTTSFIEHNGKVALFQRSAKVRTFQHHWAGVSGGIKVAESPFECAKREIKEETGLVVGRDLTLVRSGRPLFIDNSKYQYQVFPFLFKSAKYQPEESETQIKIKLPPLSKPQPQPPSAAATSASTTAQSPSAAATAAPKPADPAASAALNIEIDWEHSSFKFVPTSEILHNKFSEATVPELDKTLDRVFIPEESEFFKQLYPKIISNKHDGASALVQSALNDVLDAWIADQKASPQVDLEVLIRRMKNMAWHLDQARPNMVAIGNTVTQAVAATLTVHENKLSETSKDKILNDFKAQLQQIATEQVNVCTEIGTYLAHELFFKYSILATKLNILSISQSRTVVEALKQCAKLYPSLIGNVVLSESRPANEGLEMAQRLLQIKAIEKICITTEAALPSLVDEMRIDAIVIGVDCIEQDDNGNYTIVNKIGSNILKHLVNQHHIPLYILCDTMKINVAHEHRIKMKLEHGVAKDLLPENMLNNDRFKVYNPIFERVPILASDTRVKIISNIGNLELSHLNSVAKQFAENRRQLFYSRKF